MRLEGEPVLLIVCAKPSRHCPGFFFFLFFLNFIDVWLIYKPALISAVPQSDSVIYVCVCVYVCVLYVYIFILFSYSFPQAS